MHRAFLLKANKLGKENEALKKYKFDPQAYHWWPFDDFRKYAPLIDFISPPDLII